MQVAVAACALIGPGLQDWPSSLPCLRGLAPWVDAPLAVPLPSGLPGAERRRIGMAVKVAMAAAQQVFDLQGDAAGNTGVTVIDPATTPAVFTSSGGDGQNCHLLCEALAQAHPQVSPTRFTNSVHNAPSGYWSIASGCTASSVSLSGFDGSVAAGLIEAALLVVTDACPVLLVAYDVPYPAPLHAVRPITTPFAVALLLVPEDAEPDGQTNRTFLRIGGVRAGKRNESTNATMNNAMSDPGLEALRTSVPAARALPLLAAIARGENCLLSLEAAGGGSLAIHVRTTR